MDLFDFLADFGSNFIIGSTGKTGSALNTSSTSNTSGVSNITNVVVLKGLNESVLFSGLFISRVAESLGCTRLVLDVSTFRYRDLLRVLGVSSLGPPVCYVLKSVESFSDSDLEKLLSFLSNYTGSNYIFLDLVPTSFINRNSLDFFELSLNIEVSSVAQFRLLFNFIYGSGGSFSSRFFESILRLYKRFSLEVAFMLLEYQFVLGSRHNPFMSIYLDRLMPRKHSFFKLSQNFFSKGFRSFSVLWRSLSDFYPVEFWISYWSSQLWQAALFLDEFHERGSGSRNTNTYGGVRKFNLPFSFLNTGFRKYSINEISRAHTFLCNLDFKNKNAILEENYIDLFLAKFILNGFQ